ncbi:deoxyribose-phosphate aldolase [Candidatus Shapirobacteria bacterium CG10_big_fil_rev_8_21_14_0_10_48_15]|uniref:Deoxyribose-phosphate aldolase n=1 Tax=Candidatus Shapirobacteria bacterium CG10_big_fil_rev_8_21_14_0_10_48_15 TaxID=1974484 RepID=A0A2M8L7U6_9BACT|nr:MAG: deoxyribose-phosphate aldolase [Candidatus Shapirobacteria bacterium CG10_big_fil_rev_8_21_14_0_10_48_15]
MNAKTLAKYLDFANHRQDATPEQIRQLCQKVKQYGFNSAFVNPCYVALAHDLLFGKAAVGTVVSFPLGQDQTDLKILTAMEATRRGAGELDVSMNIGWFKAGQHDQVLEEMKAVVTAVKSLPQKPLVKFIIETGCLDVVQIQEAAQLVWQSGADFVKICSGMGPRGASLEDVKLVRTVVGDKIKVKVAGGIHNLPQALAFIEAGADRIGTSKAVEIVEALSK